MFPKSVLFSSSEFNHDHNTMADLAATSEDTPSSVRVLLISANVGSVFEDVSRPT